MHGDGVNDNAKVSVEGRVPMVVTWRAARAAITRGSDVRAGRQRGAPACGYTYGVLAFAV